MCFERIGQGSIPSCITLLKQIKTILLGEQVIIYSVQITSTRVESLYLLQTNLLVLGKRLRVHLESIYVIELIEISCCTQYAKLLLRLWHSPFHKVSTNLVFIGVQYALTKLVAFV